MASRFNPLKNRKNNSEQEVVLVNKPAKSSGEKRERRRNPDEMLGSVVNESTIGPAIELMLGVKEFVIKYNGEDAFVLPILDVATIGGLSKKQRNDQAKGALLELIRSDTIKVFVDKDMLEKQHLGFIPDAVTLDRMDEISILFKARYQLSIVHVDNGVLKFLDIGEPVDFEQLQRIHKGVDLIDDVVEEQKALGLGLDNVVSTDTALSNNEVVNSDMGGENDNVDDVTNDGATTSSDVSAVRSQPSLDMDDLSPSNTSSDENNEEADFGEHTTSSSAPSMVYSDGDEVDNGESFDSLDEPMGDSSYYGDDDDSLSDDDYLESDDDVVEPEEVNQTLNSRFLHSNLEVKIDGHEFDVFVNNAKFDPPFLTFDNSDGWMAPHVNGLVQGYNAELRELHNSHIDQLREEYFALMGRSVIDIEKDLDLDSFETYYGKEKNRIDTLKSLQFEKIDEIVYQNKSQIEETYAKNLKEFVDSAASHAKVEYEQNHGSRKDDRIEKLRNEVTNDINSTYSANERQLLQNRREEAGKIVDIAASNVLINLRPKHEVLMQQEIDLANKFSSEIKEFINNHKSDDIAWTKAQNESLARDETIARKTDEFKSQLAAEEERSRIQIASLTSQIEALTASNEARMKERESAWEAELSTLRDSLTMANERVKVVEGREKTAHENAAQEYVGQLETVKAERDAARNETVNVVKASKRNTYATIGLGLLGMAGAGLLGSMVHLHDDNNKTSTAPVTITQTVSPSAVSSSKVATTPSKGSAKSSSDNHASTHSSSPSDISKVATPSASPTHG